MENKLLIRASSMGKVMTNDRSGKAMGETAKSYLKLLWKQHRYDRVHDFTSKYTEKGSVQEELGITLLSLHLGKLFKKNTERIENEYLSGLPDLYLGESINNATEGYDTKCPWTVFSAPLPNDELDKDYFYQAMAYMALTGAKVWTIAFTLVNAPYNLIDDAKKRVWYQLGCPGDENEVYYEKCVEIEKNMIYDLKQFRDDYPNYDLMCKVWKYDIPMKERVVLFPVQRDEVVIESMYQRVRECRDYIANNFNFYE